MLASKFLLVVGFVGLFSAAASTSAASASSDAEAAVVRFNAWLAQYTVAPSSEARAALHDEGEQLLLLRADVMRTSLAAPSDTNVIRALTIARALNSPTRELLGVDFPGLVELWVDGTIDLRIFTATSVVRNNHSAPSGGCHRSIFGVILGHSISRVITTVGYSSRLTTADGVPMHGFLWGAAQEILVADPSPARCEAAAGGQYKCNVRSNSSVYRNPLRAFVDGEIQRAAVLRPHRTPLSHPPAPHGNHGSHGERRLDKVTTSLSTGVQTLLAVRAVFAGQTAADMDTSTADFISLINGVAAYHTRNSFGTVTFTPTIISDCIYVMNLTLVANYAVDTEYVLFPSLKWATRDLFVTAAGSTGTCVSHDPYAYQHFVGILPYQSWIPWAGLAETPGLSVMINGYYGAETTGILGHELGHNMGLLHANVIDPRTTASQSSAEYGDATDTMGSGSQDVPISADGGTYNPSEFNVGYKDALNWVPAGTLFSADPASINSTSSSLLLQGSDRGTSTTASGAYLGVVTSTPDGWSDRYLYIGYRHLWPTATNGLLMHEMSFGFIDTEETGYPTWTANNIGKSLIRDTLPSTPGLADADVSPGDPYVYSTGPASARLLIENLGVLALPPAATSADNAISARLVWLDALGQRPDGRGCSVSSGTCVPSISTPSQLSCGGSLSASLTALASVGVWQLTASGGAPSGQLVVLSSCSSSTSGTTIAAFTDLPVGAAYFGSTLARGAVSFSNATVAGGGGTSVSPCGTITVPFGPGASYYIVVGMSSPLTLPNTASVTVSASCSTSVSCSTPSTYLSISGLPSSLSWFNGLYQIDIVTPITNGRLTWEKQGLGSDPRRTRLLWDSGNSRWDLGSTMWPDGGWSDTTGTNSPYAWSTGGSAGAVDVTSTSGAWQDSYGNPLSSLSITCACEPNLLQASAGGACSSCPGGNMYTPALASSSSSCGCRSGWGYSGATGGCTVCPADTFRQGYGFAHEACIACPAGMHSIAGSTSVLACVPTAACDAVTISNTYSNLNGVYTRAAGTYAGYPYWFSPSQNLYLAFENDWQSPYVVGAVGAWALVTSDFSQYYAVAYTRDLPQFWSNRANYPSGMFYNGNFDDGPSTPASIVCSCTSGSPNSLGKCPTPTPNPVPCPEGWVSSGGGTACTQCPNAYNVASAGVCTCASGYTGAGCTPPPALTVSNAGGLSGAYAFNGSAFLTSTDSVKSPVYSCSTCSVGPTFLSYRSDRKEWSFAPSPAFASSVPRYAYIPSTSLALPVGGSIALASYNASSHAFDDMSVVVTIASAVTPSGTSTPSNTATQSRSASVTPSGTPTPSNTATQSRSASVTPSGTPTPSITPSGTPTASRTPTSSPSGSTTPSNTPSSSQTPTHSPTASVTASGTPSSSITPSRTPTASGTASNTPTGSNSPSSSRSSSKTPSSSLTSTPTPSILASFSHAAQPSAAAGGTAIVTITGIVIGGCALREFQTLPGIVVTFQSSLAAYLGVSASQVEVVGAVDTSSRRLLTGASSQVEVFDDGNAGRRLSTSSVSVNAFVYLSTSNSAADVTAAASNSAAMSSAVSSAIAPLLATATGRSAGSFTVSSSGAAAVGYQNLAGSPMPVPSNAPSSPASILSTTNIIIIAAVGGGVVLLVIILVAVAMTRRAKGRKERAAEEAAAGAGAAGGRAAAAAAAARTQRREASAVPPPPPPPQQMRPALQQQWLQPHQQQPQMAAAPAAYDAPPPYASAIAMPSSNGRNSRATPGRHSEDPAPEGAFQGENPMGVGASPGVGRQLSSASQKASGRRLGQGNSRVEHV